jgi:hypothetical protein
MATRLDRLKTRVYRLERTEPCWANRNITDGFEGREQTDEIYYSMLDRWIDDSLKAFEYLDLD